MFRGAVFSGHGVIWQVMFTIGSQARQDWQES